MVKNGFSCLYRLPSQNNFVPALSNINNLPPTCSFILGNLNENF